MYCQTRITCSDCMCAGLQVLLHPDELCSMKSLEEGVHAVPHEPPRERRPRVPHLPEQIPAIEMSDMV